MEMQRAFHTPRFTGFGALFEMVPVCVVAQLFMHNTLFPTHQHLSPTTPTFTKRYKPIVFSSEIGLSLFCDLHKIRGVAMICQAAPRNVQVWGACHFSLYCRGPCILLRDHRLRGHAADGACRKNENFVFSAGVLIVFKPRGTPRPARADPQEDIPRGKSPRPPSAAPSNGTACCGQTKPNDG